MDYQYLIGAMSEVVFSGLLSAFGATAKYIYDIVTQKVNTFILALFCGNVFIAFFVGVLANSIIDPDNQFRDAIFMLCGMAAIKIFTLAETTFEGIADQFARSLSKRFLDKHQNRKDKNDDN